MSVAGAWLVSNSHWILPTIGWILSEIQGWKSGGNKASISQVLVDLLKFIASLKKPKDGEK